MGLLDNLIAALGQSDQSGGQIPAPVAEAELARLAEAERLRKQPQAGAGPMAGLLSGMGMPGASSAPLSDLQGAPIDPFAGSDPKPPAPVTPAFGPVPGLLSAPYQMAAGNGMSPGPYNMMPDEPAAAAQPDLPPSTNDPMANEPQVFADGVPLPRPRPISAANATGAAPLSMAPGDDSAAIPPEAKVAGPAPAAAAPAGPSLLDQIGAGLNNNPSTLLALGAGFAGAPSFGTGMRRAFAGASPAVAADRANAQKQQGIAATYSSMRDQLIKQGMDSREASNISLAASQNPDFMKAVIGKYFETKPLVPHKIGTDMMGNDVMGSFNPNTGKYYDAANREIKADGESGGSGIGGSNNAGILAKGVKDYDSSLPADEYKAQFSPEVQAQMDAYARGDTQPTGNPRMKGLATKIKEWTQTWGSKAGVPVSDALFSERRKFLTELGSVGAATAGGQVKAFNQGIEHADALASKLEQLGNVDPVGIPSVAHGLNWARQAFSSKQTGLAKEAAGIGQTLAGEVGKLFSGSAGGGVHERELTRQRFNTVTSPAELAGALEGTLETMQGGLHALEARRDATLTPQEAAKRQFVTAETQQRLDRIRGVIGRLRGDEDAQPAPAQILKPGASTVINGVTIKRLN